MSRKVFVAMSGGVDSSVAAALLKERGFSVVGIHIKMWGPQEDQTDKNGEAGENAIQLHRAERFIERSDSPISSADLVCQQQAQDRYDAMRVAAHLDIPFQTWDFTEEYGRAVVDYMIREYAGGRTPNPDVMCNRHIKFGLFLERAIEMGADWVATGHYVRKPETRNPKPETNSKSKIQNFKLLSARDLQKDQSYFLWTLTQEQLKRCLFPIGEYTKPEVRELARRLGLPTAEKPDSQGICFIGEINIREFLRRYIPERRGRVLTTAGRTVGKHDGIEFYTIGQREGIGIGGGIPYYVAEKDVAANTLTVAEGPYDEKLFRRELVAIDVSWISGQEPKFPLRCEARIRYRQPLQRCIVQTDENGEVGEVAAKTTSPSEAIHQAKRLNNLIVTFAEPQRAVTPGQSIVFYQDDSFDPAQGREMLGGGVIA